MILTGLPRGLHDDPCPLCAAQRNAGAVRQPDGSVLRGRHGDPSTTHGGVATYRSGRREVVVPKYAASPLRHRHIGPPVAHHIPGPTRIGREMTGAMALRPPDRLVSRLGTPVDRLPEGFEGAADLIGGIPAATPAEVIGDLRDVPQEERGPF